jgi:arsenate reductase
MGSVKVYTLANCDTCRRATKWLRENQISFEERAIRETPPTVDELRAMLKACDGELRKLFNTAGQDYRAQNLAEKLPTLSVDAALRLLASNGNLVKRPFTIGGKVAVVGFNAERWAEEFRSP